MIKTTALSNPADEAPALVKHAPSMSACGLTSQAAQDELQKVGPNSMPDTAEHPWARITEKLWAPVPWMLEAAIVLQLVLHKWVEAAVIAALLTFNAAIGYFQEGKAQATLAALRSRLALNASVERDGVWKIIPAAEIVPGDLIKLSLGAVVAADVRIVDGSVLLDQSMLTGESVPIEGGAGARSYAGALVRRGEARAKVMQTGARTQFGHTAELVRSAHVESAQQKAVLRVVRNLALFNGVIIIGLLAYAFVDGLESSETIALVLTAVLAAIPVALPATFTLASALGARALATFGVLPTRLSAVDEAASMDIFCSDKTGTLTRNELSVASVTPIEGFNDAYVLALASLASAEGGQDPVDIAVRVRADKQKDKDTPTLKNFQPFDPVKKMSAATAKDAQGNMVQIVKGAYAAVIAMAEPSAPGAETAAALENQGYRVLAVAAGPVKPLRLIGLIALSDPPRAGASALITELRGLGVRTLMVTGDAPATAAKVADAVGLHGAICPPGPIPHDLRPNQYVVFAGIFPQGKYDLVKAFQNAHHTVGMCGDGANDAPALRQAQIGIAVSTATDVAKSAAGIVLTKPGLEGVVAAVKEGRSTYQRILTYTLNSVTKKFVNVLFLLIGLIMTGHAILTPMLMVIIMITGDFLGMSVTRDNVRPSRAPNQWNIGKLTIGCAAIAAGFLSFCTTSILVGKYKLGLDLSSLQTLAVLALVFGGEATLYSLRERRHLWSSRPGNWVIAASVADVLILSALAFFGLGMHALPVAVIGGMLIAAVLFAFVLDSIKVPVFRALLIG
jgi:H+-transporting ATPase